MTKTGDNQMKKPDRLSWEIVKLPNGSFKWIVKRGV